MDACYVADAQGGLGNDNPLMSDFQIPVSD